MQLLRYKQAKRVIDCRRNTTLMTVFKELIGVW